MLLRVDLIIFFGVVCRWCAVFESKVLSTAHSTVAESLAALGALEPHGQGADKQWAVPAGRLAVAGDRDMDADLPRKLILVRRFCFPKEFGMRLCIDEPVPLGRHGEALLKELRAFGSGAATLLLVMLLGRIARVEIVLPMPMSNHPCSYAHPAPSFESPVLENLG